MRILEEQPIEKIIVCPYCGVKIGYENEDVFTNMEGFFIECPKCHKEIVTEHFNRLLEFPVAYFSFMDGVDKTDTEIEKWVKTCVTNCIRSNTNHSVCASGNTRVTVDWYEDDEIFDINISKGYYHTSISKEEANKLIIN